MIEVVYLENNKAVEIPVRDVREGVRKAKRLSIIHGGTVLERWHEKGYRMWHRYFNDGKESKQGITVHRPGEQTR